MSKCILCRKEVDTPPHVLDAVCFNCSSSPNKKDPVNNPDHYNEGEIECIDAIEASMSLEEFQGYLKGNSLKYLWRYKYKSNPKQDLEKAQWYLTKLIGTVKPK